MTASAQPASRLAAAPADPWPLLSARLDNRDELIAALGCPAESTDGALILAAYERWGEDCPNHLLGDFAFALWDPRRHRIFCARDHAGIRQLAYYYDGRLFVCAQHPEALLSHPGVPAEPDLGNLAELLLDRFRDPAATLYRGILRLPPGHSLVVAATGLRLRRYWEPGAASSGRDDDFREVFAAAVACRLSGSVSATLSGGLDSSAIVCMARRLAPEALPTAHSMVFDGLACDERPYIDEVARASGIDVDFIAVDAAGLLDPEIPNRLPGVPCDVTFSMNFGLLESARRSGSRALLWGFGGDELLSSGDAYLSDFVRQRRLRAVVAAVRDRVQHGGFAEVGRSAFACLRPLVPQPFKAALRRIAGRAVPRWIRRDFLRQHGALEPEPAPRPCFGCEAQDSIYRGLTTGRTACYTLPASDALAAAFGIEFRHPFFDRRVIDFVLGLPPDHAELFAGKLLLREALDGILPETVRTRLDKAGFDPLIDREISQQADIITTLVRSSELAQLGAIDRKALEQDLEGYRRRASGERRDAIVSFVRAEAWLRAFEQRKQYGHRNDNEEEAVLAADFGYLR